MTAKPTKPTAFARLCASVKTIAARLADMMAVQNSRLAAIEDRLAALDDGHGAAQAKRAAVAAVNASRKADGQKPLGLRVASEGDAFEWCGADTMGRPKQ